jgi:hypothetical protein
MTTLIPHRWRPGSSPASAARSEAHDSGLCAADAETKRRFARNLLNLTLANPRVNRYEKRGKDAAEWLPNLNQCWFAARIVEVRRKYDLTIDRREAEGLGACDPEFPIWTFGSPSIHPLLSGA